LAVHFATAESVNALGEHADSEQNPWHKVFLVTFGLAISASREAAMPGDTAGLTLTDSVFEQLLRSRIVFLGSEVDDDIANRITAQLLLLAAEDGTRDITFYINSPGGSVTAGMAIYDTMQLIEPDVATWGLGFVASMGQFLLSSGTPGKRYVLPNTRIVMHQPSGGVGGTATDIAIRAAVLGQMKLRMAELTAAQTGQTVRRITEDADRDRWFTADEALEYGFVDHIVQRPPVAVA
jgi:ATP-dependent Clp protease protease subunit